MRAWAARSCRCAESGESDVELVRAYSGCSRLPDHRDIHPIVIKCEYYFGEKVWPGLLVLGLLCGGASLLTEDGTASGVLGILSCVLLWCIHELKEQAQRVECGWLTAP
ncbi:MAG: DUF4491 family protein [Fretibacterium sp.]|nr:DUF4491 family protein [Fretibacterium sp.]